MITISKAEIERMQNNILDQETEMSELDLFEYEHSFEEWVII